MTGLSQLRCALISESMSWDEIPVSDMKRFLTATRCDPENRQQFKRIGDYLKGRRMNSQGKKRLRQPSFGHLRRSPDWKNYYLPLLVKWRRHYGPVTAQADIWPPVRELLIKYSPLLELK